MRGNVFLCDPLYVLKVTKVYWVWSVAQRNSEQSSPVQRPFSWSQSCGCNHVDHWCDVWYCCGCQHAHLAEGHFPFNSNCLITSFCLCIACSCRLVFLRWISLTVYFDLVDELALHCPWQICLSHAETVSKWWRLGSLSLHQQIAKTLVFSEVSCMQVFLIQHPEQRVKWVGWLRFLAFT